MHFLCQKEYTGERGALSRKVRYTIIISTIVIHFTFQMVSAVFDPIRFGVRAFGSAVTTMPDTVYGGVARVGDGINKAAKQVLGGGSGGVRNDYFSDL